MPKNLRLIAYNESSQEVYPDLAIFPMSDDPMINQIYLPPDTTGVIVWSDNPDTENQLSQLTVSAL